MYMRKGQKLSKPRFNRHFLKEWRERKGFTQESLADRIDRSHATIQRIENMQQALGQPVLDRLAAALGVTRGQILDEKPKN